jgi:transcriptional regulator with XRE-family HTH domain
MRTRIGWDTIGIKGKENEQSLMNPKQQADLAERVRVLRTKLGISQTELASRCEVAQSTIVRIEQGAFREVSPDVLRRIADTLGVPAFELFEIADVTTAKDLPQFTPYLRTKYKKLTKGDVEAIEEFARSIAQRRGVSLGGPKPGEDE